MMVVFIGWGLCWRVGNTVFAYEGLKQRPGLLSRIMDHEKKHKAGRWCLDDFRHDIRSPVDWEGLLFMLRNPRTWLQLSPIVRLGDEWFFERTVILGWLLVFFVVLLCGSVWVGVSRGVF